MFRPRQRRLRGLSFNRMLPNMLTMLALCAGLTALRYGLEGKWQPAIVALVFAAIFDALDGRIARLLQGTSKFGAELDSLSDFIAFGVAPAVILYLWTMQTAGPVGWVPVLLFNVCMALRLARFNTVMDDDEPPAWAKGYFTGVPAPAAAGLVMVPMVLWFQVEAEWLRQPLLVGAVIIVVACLMVSKLPTYSFKNIRIQQRFVLAPMLGVGLLAALGVSAPWLTMTLIVAAYVATIPFSIRSYRRAEAEARELAQGTNMAADMAADAPSDAPAANDEAAE